MTFTCAYCNMRFTGMNAYIKHKRRHMERTTPIYDPLNPKISRFAEPRNNSVWDTGVKL